MAIPELEEALALMRRERRTGQVVVHIKDGEPRSVELVLRQAVATISAVSVRTFYPTASGVRVVGS